MRIVALRKALTFPGYPPSVFVATGGGAIHLGERTRWILVNLKADQGLVFIGDGPWFERLSGIDLLTGLQEPPGCSAQYPSSRRSKFTVARVAGRWRLAIFGSTKANTTEALIAAEMPDVIAMETSGRVLDGFSSRFTALRI